MALPGLRLLPLVKAPRLIFHAFPLCVVTGALLPASVPPSTAGSPLSRGTRQCAAHPQSSSVAAGFCSPFNGSSIRSLSSPASTRTDLTRPSLVPSFRVAASRAMSEAPPFAPVPRPVDAANGIQKILAFWLGDWAATADTAVDVSEEERMSKMAIWFMRNDALDSEIRDAFAALVEQGREGKLGAWEETPLGTAALIILLDQFSRNIFRNSPDAFAADPKAVQIAKTCIEKGFDKKVPGPIRNFIYLPFMHSEDLATSTRGIELYDEFLKELPEGPVKAYTESTLKFSILHTDVIKKFGRFPHRNAALGRESTPEEIEFVKQGGGF